MILLVQVLQIVSGALWLLPALYLSPRVLHVWRRDESRTTAIFARNACLSWLMAGYVVRWLVWPHALTMMTRTELTTWAALYALSGICALWFLRDALATRGQ